jgi:Protein kinase domain
MADFGLTQSASDHGPADGSLMGTLDYISPEQIRGDEFDGRADQYALGCLLFECLTGTLPFRRESEMATIFAHLEEPPPAASDHRPGLPPELDDVLARAMAKDPADRYESCEALGSAARSASGLDAQPVSRTRSVVLVAALVAVLAGALALVLITGGEERAAAARPAGVVARVDAESGRVTARYEIGGKSGAIAVGSGSVWVGSVLDSSLWRVEPRSGDVRRIDIAGLPRDLAYHEGKIYIGAEGPGYEGHVVAYDAATGLREDAVEKYSCAITAGAREGVWSNDCNQAYRLEGDTRRLRAGKGVFLPFAEPLTSGTFRGCLCDMAAGSGSVWVPGTATDPRVFRIDARTGRVRDTIELPFAIGRGIAAGDGALWVTDAARDIVARIDIRSGRVTDRIAVGRTPIGLALAGDDLWVANFLDRTVSLIDAGRRRAVRTVSIGAAPIEVAADARGVWVAADE